jgi:pimeloyl-ACP methyl ester carboxylesterase
MPQEPSITVDYWVPLDAAGKLLPTANDVVVAFPHSAQPTLKSLNYATPLVDGAGFTVLMPQFQNRKAPVDGQPEASFYLYPASGSGEVYQRAMAQLVQVEGLRDPQWFAMGFSAGASAAQQFASAYPEQIAALFNGSGGTFNFEKPYRGPIVSLRTSVDRIEQTRDLLTALAKHGRSFEDIVYPPGWRLRAPGNFWYHTTSPEAMAFGIHWLRWVADGRRQGRSAEAPWPAELTALRQAIVPVAQPADLTDLASGVVAWRNGPRQAPERNLLWLDARFTAGEDDVRGTADLWAAKGVAVLALTDDARLDAPGIQRVLQRAQEQRWLALANVAVVAIEPDGDRIAVLESLAKPGRPVVAWFGTPRKAARFAKRLSPGSPLQVRSLALITDKEQQETTYATTLATTQKALAAAQQAVDALKPAKDAEWAAMKARQQDERAALQTRLRGLPRDQQVTVKAEQEALGVRHKAETTAWTTAWTQRQQEATAALKAAKAAIPKAPKEIKLPSFWGEALQARVDDVALALEKPTACADP